MRRGDDYLRDRGMFHGKLNTLDTIMERILWPWLPIATIVMLVVQAFR